MPKSYKVGDTEYQFPDEFDDNKVQSILTEQGVIKPSGPQGGYGVLNDIGTGVKDALAGVGSGVISTGVGAYNLARKLPGIGDALPAPNEYVQGLTKPPDSIPGQIGHYAEQAAEYALPGGASKGAGLLRRALVNGMEAAGVAGLQSGGNPASMATAGVLGGAGTAIPEAYQVGRKIASDPAARDAVIEMLPKGKQALKLRGILQNEPVPYQANTPTPKPNMPKYGGPIDQSGGAPGRMVPRRGFTPPEEVIAEEVVDKPFKPSAVTKRNMGPSGGLPEETVGQARRLPPREPAMAGKESLVPGAEEEAAAVDYRFRPSKETAKKLRGGGADNPYGSPSYRNRPRPASRGGVPDMGEAAGAAGTYAPPVMEAPVASAEPPATLQANPRAMQAAKALEDEMRSSDSAPPPPSQGIPRESYESENRHLKTAAVDALLKKHGISWEDAQKHFSDQDWLNVFAEAKQNAPGFYSGNPAISKGQTLIKGGAPINKLRPKAKGGIVAPKRPQPPQIPNMETFNR